MPLCPGAAAADRSTAAAAAAAVDVVGPGLRRPPRCRSPSPGRSRSWATGLWSPYWSPEASERRQCPITSSTTEKKQDGCDRVTLGDGCHLRWAGLSGGVSEEGPSSSQSNDKRKSSLTIQFVEGQFVDSYDPTIENTFTKLITVNGQEYHLQLVDTAGQDEYSIFPQTYSIDINGYILVYSVTSIKSFEVIKVIHGKLLDMVGKVQIPIMLVGNKKDLHMERVISYEEGKALAESWNAAFLESSAKENQEPLRGTTSSVPITRASGEAVKCWEQFDVRH
uniref:Ras homolog, mTORC1 binding n=1 Tax=Felis catus TaxID=9685 RepID=A0ABI7XWR8_FELCA